jgi:hypothetical protein
MNAHLDHVPANTPVQIWFQDEARNGQKNGIVRQWARRGTRLRQPADQSYANANLFGANCPARGKSVGLALPHADTQAMQLHIEEIFTPCCRRRPCRSLVRPGRMAHHDSTCYALKHHAVLPALAFPQTEPGPEQMAVSALKLALKPRLRILPIHHRRSLRRVAQTSCIARYNRFNRHERMGAHRSFQMTLGIRRNANSVKLLKWLAGGLGFEPRQSESESEGLPLADPPTSPCRA